MSLDQEPPDVLSNLSYSTKLNPESFTSSPTPPPTGASAQPSQTYQQDVDVSSDAAPILQDLLHPSQQHAENGLLDVFMPMDAGSQGFGQLVKDILR